MKRFSIIVLGALAILMAGCSKDVPVSPPDENAWVNDVNLPVPIQFGHASLTAVTKADDLGMIEGTVLSERTVGVLGIDANASSWSQGQSNKLNSEATLLHRSETTTAEGDIVFKPKEYYPLVSDKEYDFFGYYPHDISANIKLSAREQELPGSALGNQVLFVNYEEIGYKDILWGGTTNNPKTFQYDVDENGAPLTVTGYNAKYIRKVKQAELELLNGRNESDLSDSEKEQLEELRSYFPTLQFKHCLSAARFYVQAKDSYAASTFVGTDSKGNPFNIMEVTGLTLHGLYRTGSLILAMKNDSYSEDDIAKYEGTVIPSLGTSPSSHTLTKPDKSAINVVTPTSNLQELGNGLMIIPGSDALDYGSHISGEIHYNICRETANGSIEKLPHTMAVEFPVKSHENFKAGKRYTFTVVFNSLEEIVIKTGLEAWDDHHAGGSVDGVNGEGGEKIEIE